MSEKNIYQRLNDVMKEVSYVQKDKQISGGGSNYKAVTHDQVISVAREFLVNHGIVIYPEQLKSEMLITRDVKKDIKMHLYSADYAIHFVNIDKPDDRLSVTINSHAADNGDKAPGKAITYATKAALLKVLCLETGENDESRAEERATITAEQAEEIDILIEQTKTDPSKFRAAYKISSVDSLPAKMYDQAIAQLNTKKAK